MNLIVTGAEDYTKEWNVFEALDYYYTKTTSPMVIVTGGGKGADAAALLWTTSINLYNNNSVDLFEIPAHWTAPCAPWCPSKHRVRKGFRTQCPSAGSFRNERMLLSMPDVVLTFGSSPIVADLVTQALTAQALTRGITVMDGERLLESSEYLLWKNRSINEGR